MNPTKSVLSYMSSIGRKGGSASTPAKIAAARANGKKPKRPRKANPVNDLAK